ncbi:autophagy-related protein 22-like protein [Lentinula raphanica]|uniref:Autophagy-related protein n=1 Tax=Lentinula raphanica TaxID=153919 RepID=A0AA38PFT1_9AGAR|nr:MFS general substrate transporter [Lentinula raphanica]KAJ3841931.1 autophagy-related protein 22-like protein [Lentinula raphanica]
MLSQFRKKYYGWLSYAFASEVFVIVSLTLFLPICLEQFARDNGYLYPAKTERCSTIVSKLNEDSPPGRCVVKIGWFWIDSASFSLYVFSASVLLQALTVISVGGIADHPPHRKILLLTCAWAGALAATFFLPLSSNSPFWFLSALLAVIANVGFGTSVVAMNAYLPSLAKESPEVVKAYASFRNAEGSVSVLGTETDDNNGHEAIDQPLIHRPTTQAVQNLKSQYEDELSRTTSRISSFGIALGYGAGIFLLFVALIPVTIMKGATFSLRLAIFLSGIWWAVFTIPALIWLPSGQNNALIDDEDAVWVDVETVAAGKWSLWKEVVAAWQRLGGMLKWSEIKRLRNTFKFLAAWFLLSDAFTTITGTAILFAKTVLNIESSSLIVIGIIVPSSGILGSLFWPRMQRRYGWSNQRILLILLVLASLVPAYGCLGFISFLQGRIGGLTTKGEMFGLAIYFGFVLGAFNGYARAFYAEFLPPGEEARWYVYGLFSITDKSSSFIGPLIVGLISDLTGNIRYAFFFLVVMIWLAVPILMSVDVERGRKDAQSYRYSLMNVTP